MAEIEENDELSSIDKKRQISRRLGGIGTFLQ
jgi:hypothetical protein